MKISELDGISGPVDENSTFIINYSDGYTDPTTIRVSANQVFEGVLNYFSNSYSAERLASYLAPYLNNE